VCNIPLYDILHTDENVIYRPVGQAQKLGLMVDITEGMAFLHLKGIIHKDIMSFIRACTTYCLTQKVFSLSLPEFAKEATNM